MKRLFVNVGKIILGALAFYAGIILGSLVAGAMGMLAPALPAGADAATLGQYQLFISLGLAATLAFVSRNLGGGFWSRWLILALFTWITYSVNTYLEAAIFTAYDAASSYTLVMQLVACVLCSGVIAGLYPSQEKGAAISARFGAFVGQFRVVDWVWRLVLAWLAFPAAYLVFGLLVQPFIITYYEQQMAGLALPGWGEILPTLFLRSLLFLSACLPLLIVWQKSRRHLFFTLGFALFILVGGLYMVQSYWFPVTMRVAHSLEILADSFVYAGAITFLLVKARPYAPQATFAPALK